MGTLDPAPLRGRRVQDTRTCPVLVGDGGRPDGQLEITPTPSLQVCRFGHGERRREAREEVAVVLTIGHTLRAHEALGRPDTLPGPLEVIHRFFENGVFFGHAQSIRVDLQPPSG